MGQKRLYRTATWGRDINGTARCQRGADTSTVHHNVGQKRAYSAPAWGTNVPVCPQIGQTRPHRTPAWGGHVSNTPQHGAETSTSHRNSGHIHHWDGSVSARGRDGDSEPQRAAKTPYSAPAWGTNFPVCPHMGHTSAPQPCVGQTRQHYALVWGRHMLIAPQIGADTSANRVGHKRPQSAPAWGGRVTVGRERPQYTPVPA